MNLFNKTRRDAGASLVCRHSDFTQINTAAAPVMSLLSAGAVQCISGAALGSTVLLGLAALPVPGQMGTPLAWVHLLCSTNAQRGR